MEQLIELYHAWVEAQDEQTWKAFEQQAKLHYGDATYKQCLEFFVTFGGADLYDKVTDKHGRLVSN